MKRLNYAKRLHGPLGNIMQELFQQTLAPSLAQGFNQSSKTDAVFSSFSVRQAFGETAIVLHDQRQLITSISISSPSVSLTFVTLGAMFELDILLIDLSRPGAPVVCCFERAGVNEVLDDEMCPLVLWVGSSGKVALVPGRAEISGKQTWPASILFWAGRLQDAAAHPFADEDDRLGGIERAIQIVERATAACNNGPLLTSEGLR